MTSEEQELLRDFGGEECSGEMDRAFRHSGSNRIQCEACGRVHFAKEGDFEEGELDELDESVRNDPDRFIEHSDFVSWGSVTDMQVVVDCPCGFAAHVEKLVLANKCWILRLILNVAKNENRQADSDLEAAQAVTDVVDAADSATRGQ